MVKLFASKIRASPLDNVGKMSDFPFVLNTPTLSLVFCINMDKSFSRIATNFGKKETDVLPTSVKQAIIPHIGIDFGNNNAVVRTAYFVE